MDERAQRIVETAIDLAEKDGFAAVRLRDVAAQAEVALGTLYRRFRSKEEILVAALEQEAGHLEKRIRRSPPKGANAQERLAKFFRSATAGLCRRPNLARALVRAVACAEPEVTDKVASFHAQMTGMIVASLRGDGSTDLPANDEEQKIAMVLQQIWFASLVGWAGGIHDQSSIAAHVESAASMILSDTKP